MQVNHKCIVIVFLILFTCLSCEKNEEDNVPVQLSVTYVFAPIITDMTDSSPIHLPDGINYEVTIINSEQELVDSLSSDIIASDILYNDIDYINSSLLSLRFRSFYKPNKIEYKIFKDNNGQIAIKQILNVSDSLRVEGYFIMSNLIIDRLSEHDKISFEQSFAFEHGIEDNS